MLTGPIFVSFEGGEGAGKSIQAETLHERLWAVGVRAKYVHEPGSTPLGWYLREFLLKKPRLSREAELLLFEAARAELVINEIKPGLQAGFTVISDRFEASSIAYQGHGRRIDLDVIQFLNSFATHGIYPELTFLLDLDPVEGLRRVGNPQLALPLEPDDSFGPGRQDIEGHRRFEDQPLKFHERVREGYLSLAQSDPKRWVVVDGTRTVADISNEVWQHVSRCMGLPGDAGAIHVHSQLSCGRDAVATDGNPEHPAHGSTSSPRTEPGS